MIRRLILLRHGQTHYNATMRMQGQLDTELSETGVRQANTVARVLADRGPIHVVSSDLTRAHDTARALGDAAGVDVRTDPRLRETHLGDWQGKTHQEVDSAWPDARRGWRNDPLWAPPGGESRVDVAHRGLPVVRELLEELPEWGVHGDHPVVLVAHGGFIAALTAGLLELPIDHFPLFNGLGNTSWVQLSAHPREDDLVAGTPERPFGAGPFTWRLDVWNASAMVGHDVL